MTKKEEKLKIKDFWWFNNDECWRIKRKGRVDFYLYTRTMRYIFKTFDGKWMGTKNPFTLLKYDKETAKTEAAKRKNFETEDHAVRWLRGDRKWK